MTRKKFQIFYPTYLSDVSKAGQQYKPSGSNMLVMNNQGIFFLYSGDSYSACIRKLSDVIGDYDVKWSE